MYRYKIALQTLGIVAVIVAVKAVVEHFNLEFIDINTLISSIIGGAVFIIGMILAGTLSDFKESERIPSEIVSSLENIYDEGCRVHAMSPQFDLEGFRAALIAVVDTFHHDLAMDDTRECLVALRRLGEYFSEMERLGLAPNFVVRLKTEQGFIRKQVLRVYHIQRTDFVPSAYILVESIIALIIVLLTVAKVQPLHNGLMIIAFISYIFLYLIRLLRTIDKPFRVTEKTMDDVSRFLLKEFCQRLKADSAAQRIGTLEEVAS